MMSAFETARLLHRAHPRMTHLAESIECPHCGADVGENCQTRNGNYATPHTIRIDMFAYLSSS